MLILPIIFICDLLHSFSAAWLEQFRHIEDFPHYFLFLPLPLACTLSASPKYACHMWGVFRPSHLKVCAWVCLCTWICSHTHFVLEKGLGVHLAEVSMSKPKSLSFVSSRPEHRSRLSPPDVCEVQVSTSLSVTPTPPPTIAFPCSIIALQMEDRSGRCSLQVWLPVEVRTKGGFGVSNIKLLKVVTVQKKSGEQGGI